jgi:hypothetical protein
MARCPNGALAARVGSIMTDKPWYTVAHEHGGFPVWCAAVGDAKLTAMNIGSGWSWVVRRHGEVVAEGTADSLAAAEAACTVP